jgi:hypothetical protein
MYVLTMRCVHITIAALEKQMEATAIKTAIVFNVKYRFGSINSKTTHNKTTISKYSTCTELYHQLWPGRLYRISKHYLTNSKVVCVWGGDSEHTMFV